MGLPQHLRPMSIGDMIDDAWKLYRRHFWYLVVAAGILTVPMAIIQAFVSLSAGDSLNAGAELPALMLISLALSLAVAAWQMAAMIQTTGRLYLEGIQTPVAELYRSSIRRWLAVVGGSILFYLGVMIGMLILLIPGILLAVWWSQYLAVIVLEGKGGYRSLGRSRRLTKGRFWLIVGITIVIGLILIIFNLIMVTVLGIGAGAGYASILGLFTGAEHPLLTILAAIIGLLATPFYYTSMVVLYYQLRIRLEGLDLELAAQKVLGTEAESTQSGM